MVDMVPFYPAIRPDSEQSALDQQLRYCRRAVIARIEDLNDAQAAARPVASTVLSVGGVVKHLAWAEDRWFVGKLLGQTLPEPWRSAPLHQQPDWPFESSDADSVDDLIDLYQEACKRSDNAVAGKHLENLAVEESFGKGPVNLRWLLLHTVSETSWHLGHLDVLRDALGVRPAPS